MKRQQLADGSRLPSPATADQQLSYGLGASLAREIKPYGLTPEEIEMVIAGLRDASDGKALSPEAQAALAQLGQLEALRLRRIAEPERLASEAFVEQAAAEKGSVRTPSGVVVQMSQAGAGKAPRIEEVVTLRYTAALRDGTVVDETGSSFVTLRLSNAPLCLSEGVRSMQPGGRGRLVCPPGTAFGDRGLAPLIAPGSALVYDLELAAVGTRLPPPAH